MLKATYLKAGRIPHFPDFTLFNMNNVDIGKIIAAINAKL
jgi:hypothetical protein